jgi:isatin hydrolase
MTPSTLAQEIRFAQVIDLSVTLSEDLPCAWPGAQPYRHKTDHWFTDVDADGRSALRTRSGAPYHTCMVVMDEHTGTHFDAPAHFVPPPGSGLADAGPAGAVTAEQVDLRQLIGPALVIDVRSLTTSAGPGRSPLIGPSALLGWEEQHGRISAGDIVLFRSGWDSYYLTGADGTHYVERPLRADGPGWPAPSVSTVELLLDRGVRCAGTDAVSMGPAGDGRAVHVAALSAGMVFVEALCRLGELPPRGATFMFLPLKVQGGSGSPGRAIALV